MRNGTVIFGQIAAILIVLSLGLPIPSEAVVFWDESFEYANQATMATAWDGASCVGDNTILAPTTARPRTGAKSLQMRFTGIPLTYEGGGTCFFGGRKFTPTDTLYARWWMYLTDHAGTGNFLSGKPTTKLIFQFPLTCSICYSVVWTLPNGGYTLAASVQHAGGGTSKNVFSSGTIPQQKWTCVETLLKAESPVGATNGVIAAWINGVQVLNSTNNTLLKAGGSGPLAVVRYYTQNGLGTIYYDDLAVGNTRIGCGASPTSDLTPPAAPLNLKVQ